MPTKVYIAPPFFRRNGVSPLATVTLALAVMGCSQDANVAEVSKKLELANRRIAVLEAQLAEPKAVSLKSEVASSNAAPTAVVSAQKDAAASIEGQQWRYDVTEEKMTGGKRRTASVESNNTVEFGFPYNGMQNGHLTLRTDSQHGKDILFRIEKGQILCTSYGGCSIQVRFDDGKPVTYSASGAADHSSTLIFLDDYNRFLNGMRKAKRVRLAVNIYQQGAPVFEFDVSGFDFFKYQAKD